MAIMKLCHEQFAKVCANNVGVEIKVVGVEAGETTFDIRLSVSELETAFQRNGIRTASILGVDSNGKFEFLWDSDDDDELPYGVSAYKLSFTRDGIIKADCAPIPSQCWVIEFNEV